MNSRKLSVPAKVYARRESLIVKDIVPLRRLLLHTGTEESMSSPDPTQLALAERESKVFSVLRKQLNESVLANVIRRGQCLFQTGSQAWQCHPSGTGVRGMKDSGVEGFSVFLV